MHTRVTGDPLLRVYGAIDAAIGRIVEDAGDDARIVVVCGHGMSYFFGAQFLLREILFRLGVARPMGSGARGGAGDAMLAGARRAWRALPGVVRHAAEPLRALLRDDPHATGVPSIGVDPDASACFVVPNGLAVGGIRLNLRGREPRGTLAPEEADAFCEDLRGALLDIRDSRTKRPAIAAVHRTRDVHDGANIDHLPDLLVEWSDDLPTGSTAVANGASARVEISSPRIGTIDGSNDYGRTGEHRPGGRLIAAGPGIGHGTLDREISILDYAPTFAAMCDVALDDRDGQVIPELA
jgi:predicted AlkP superfamily phosphohydrolase/phosphomutase